MKASGVICVAVLAISLLTGCSRNLISKAQRYEVAGDNASALLTYQQALSQVKEDDHHSRSQILLRIGECLYRMDRLSEAFTTFQKAADTDNSNAIAHVRMGELLLAAGSPERAREQANVVLSQAPNDNDALALLGASWTASGNLLMATQVYQRILESDPKRVTVAVALADIYNREDDVAKARVILKDAADAQPANGLPWLAMARLEEQEGNGAEAEEAYRRAASIEEAPETNLRLAQFLQRSGRVAEAEQVLRHVDAQRRNYPVALADFQLLSGHSSDAMAQYQAALEVMSPRPQHKHFWQKWTLPLKAQTNTQPSTVPQATVAARMIEAEISATFQQAEPQRTASLAEARKRLQDFHTILDPATEAILQSELALADSNLVLANMFASTAIDLAPNSASAHYVAGMVESASGNSERARAEWQSAIENDGHFMPAQLALAEDALQRGNGSEADDYARDVVRDDPGNFQALVVFARALLLETKPSSAAVMAQRAAALDPTSSEPMILMGEVALQTNHLPQAMLSFEKAVVTHPESDEAIDGLLRVYRRGPLSFAALEKMERVAQEAPVSSTLLEIAGRLYADHGWYKEAIRALTAAVQVDPSRTTATRMLARLKLQIGDFSQASQAAAHSGPVQEPLLRAYEADAAGNRQQAIAEYERAVRQGDQTGAAANNLAWLYAQQGSQLDRALGLAITAVKLSPNNASVLDTLGFVYLQRREFTTAVKVLETAARLASGSATPAKREVAMQIRKHLSDAYLSSGQTDAAIQIAQNRCQLADK